MKLFVGLGNPGPGHAGNRHNIGWMAVDAIAAEHGFGPFRAKFRGRVAEGRLGAEKALILKPETFMNLSGQSVGEAARFYKLEPADIVVFHDELDLSPGKVRVKRGGGHAGHNGLRSIHQHFGPDYARVRLGIGHPGDKARVSGYVLSDFAASDKAWLDPLIEAVALAAPRLAENDAPAFQNQVAQRLAPTRTPAAPAASEPPPEPDPPARSSSPFARLVERFSRS